MAHDPSLGYADYFAAASVVPEVDVVVHGGGEPDMYGDLHHHHHHHGTTAEMFGVRGLVPADEHPVLHGGGKAALGIVDGAGAALHFGEHGELSQYHHRQVSQAPLSLSLHGPATSSTLAQSQAQQHHQTPPPGTAWQLHGAGGGWHLRGSRFLLPAQQLLQEFCSLPVKISTKNPAQEDGGASSSSSSTQIQSMDAAELQRLKAKLYTMLEEVDRRYMRYCEQMRGVAGAFEAVAGERAAMGYTRLASRTISRHFRSLRDGVVAQVQVVRRQLGEKDTGGGGGVPGMTKGDTPRLRVLDQCIRQNRAYQSGMLETHPWRPQRGLPERAVSILRAWLFEHFLHPYPSDVDKHILARQTGLSRSQVANWFINARVRLWKPMVEEMYAEEMKDEEGSNGGGGQSQTTSGANAQNPSTGSFNPAAEARGVGVGVGEQKPTRAQLMHDAGSLASVVSIGHGGAGGVRVDNHHQSLNFGMVEHLGFDAYDAGGGAQGYAGGVSLTLGLQQQQHGDSSHDGVNVAFAAATQGAEFLFMSGGEHPSSHVHHGQVGAAAVMEGDAASRYGRGLSASTAAGFHLLHDLAG